MGYDKKFNKTSYVNRTVAAFEVLIEGKIKGFYDEPFDSKWISKYEGFGAFKELMSDPYKDSDWDKNNLQFRESVRKVYDLVGKYVDYQYPKMKIDKSRDEVYKLAIQGIKNSTLTSFFTEKVLVDAMVKPIAEKIKNGSFLDPSAGTGRFMESFLENSLNNNNEVIGIEKEAYTYLFGKYLLKDSLLNNDNVKYIRKTFETYKIEDNSINFIASNIPFGDIKVFDPEFFKSKEKVRSQSTNAIHNYFFLKSLDALKKDGYLAFITSTGVMDSQRSTDLREYLMLHSKIASAIRLPNNTFEENAGTEVNSDIIILQKRDKAIRIDQLSDDDKAFISLGKLDNGYKTNGYYIKNPQNVLGYWDEAYMHGGKGLALKPNNENDSIDKIAANVARIIQNDLNNKIDNSVLFSENISSLFTKIETPQLNLFDLGTTDANVTKPEKQKSVLLSNFNGQNDVINGLIYDSNKVVYRVDTLNRKKESGLITPLDIKDTNRLIALIDVHSSVNKLKQYEVDRESINESIRIVANNKYDEFVSKYGSIGSKENKEVRDLFIDEFTLRAYEKVVDGKFVKADFFLNGFIIRENEDVKTLTLEDAMMLSMANYLKVDFEFIAAKMGQEDTEKIKQECIQNGLVFPNPDFKSNVINYVTKDEFQSGLVQYKIDYLTEHKEAIYGSNEVEYYRDLALLNEVCPEKISIEEIDINLGEEWVPLSVFREFTKIYFDDFVKIERLKGSGGYLIEGEKFNDRSKDLSVKCQSGRTVSGFDVLKLAMEGTSPNITYSIEQSSGYKKVYVDKEAISLVNQNIRIINDEFKQYIINNQKLATDLETMYYERFVGNIKRKYDGSHLTLPGFNYNAFTPHFYQKDAVWQNVLSNGIMGDQAVGAGKTIIMAMSAMEMKRLNIAKKPMLICLNANVKGVYSDFLKAYPNANILYPSEKEFLPENRKALFHRIANNDWDAVILTHDQFKKIDQDPKIELQILQEELRNIEDDLSTLNDGEKASKRQLTGLEKRKENITVKVSMLYETIERDNDVPNFKEMGIDHLMVDESQYFKNLMYTTRHNNVSGMGDPSGSQRAANLLIACRTLQDLHKGDKGISFFSGTPVSNSLVELYLIKKYLRPNYLESVGLNSFDAWARTFAELSSQPEITVSNTIKSKSRFRAFTKVPELIKMYLDIANVVGPEEMKDVDRPKEEVIRRIIEPTDELQEFNEILVRCIQSKDFSELGLDYTEEQLSAMQLLVTGLASKAAIDLRLIDDNETYSEYNSAKLKDLYEQVQMEYYNSNDYKGTQLIFCDLGTPGSNKGFTVYEEIKRSLVNEFAIPENEIAFIHDYKTKPQKEKLFKLVNDGVIRIVLGSTTMMGVGVNMQERVIAMHEIDCPWRPSDTDQRWGRGIRQGNKMAKIHRDNKVKIYQYGVKNSLDAFKFFINDTKANFIRQMKSGSLKARRITEGDVEGENGADGGGMSMAELVAQLTGKDSLIKMIKVENQLKEVTAARNAQLNQLNKTKSAITANKESIIKLSKHIESAQKDLKEYNRHINGDWREKLYETYTNEKGEEKKRMVETLPGYVVSIKGKDFTNIIEIGEELHNAYKEIDNNFGDGIVKIANFGAFNMYCSYKISADEVDMFKNDDSFKSISKEIFIQMDETSSVTYKGSSVIQVNPERSGVYFLEALDDIGKRINVYASSIENKEKEISQLEQKILRYDPTQYDDQITELQTKYLELEILVNKEMTECENIAEGKDSIDEINNSFANDVPDSLKRNHLMASEDKNEYNSSANKENEDNKNNGLKM